MNESDSDAMNRARMEALEYLLLGAMDAAFADSGYPKTLPELKQIMETRIEQLAPGCSHMHYSKGVVQECKTDNDSPWLVCKSCAAAGKCSGCR
jgi:hypothetical protein